MRLPFFRDDVEFLPDLQRLEFVLQYLPDEELLRALNGKRGRGRDDYPVEAMWRALVAGLVFRHSFIAALLRELRRNPAPLQRCGFDPLPCGAGLWAGAMADEKAGVPIVWLTRPARLNRACFSTLKALNSPIRYFMVLHSISIYCSILKRIGK